MPMPKRPMPIRAPAVITAPHSARIRTSSGTILGVERIAFEDGTRPWTISGPLEVDHAQAAAHDQQDAGQNEEHTAAAATGPGSVRPAWLIPPTAPSPPPTKGARSHAHLMSP